MSAAWSFLLALGPDTAVAALLVAVCVPLLAAIWAQARLSRRRERRKRDAGRRRATWPAGISTWERAARERDGMAAGHPELIYDNDAADWAPLAVLDRELWPAGEDQLIVLEHRRRSGPADQAPR